MLQLLAVKKNQSWECKNVANFFKAQTVEYFVELFFSHNVGADAPSNGRFRPAL